MRRAYALIMMPLAAFAMVTLVFGAALEWLIRKCEGER